MIKKPSKELPKYVIWPKEIERYERRKLFAKRSRLLRELKNTDEEINKVETKQTIPLHNMPSFIKRYLDSLGP